MELKSLARTKKETEKTKSPDTIGEADKYGYGTRMSLHQEELNKLGLDPSKLKVGQKMHVHGKAEVRSVSQNKHSSGSDSHVELQFTHAHIAPHKSGLHEAVSHAVDSAQAD